MGAAWERLMASVPSDERAALSAEFYGEPSAHLRYATLLELGSYFSQARGHARADQPRRRRAADVTLDANATLDSDSWSRCGTERPQRPVQPSLAWSLCRVLSVAVALVGLVVCGTLRFALSEEEHHSVIDQAGSSNHSIDLHVEL